MTVLNDVSFYAFSKEKEEENERKFPFVPLEYQQQKAVVNSFRLHFKKIDTNRQSMKVSTQEKKHPNLLLLYVPQRDY